MKRDVSIGILAVFTLAAATAFAATTPADKCEAAKNKAAGAYYSCRAKAEAYAISKSVPADYSKCTSKFDDKYGDAETDGEGACPDDALTAPMNAYLAAQATSAAAILSGAQGVPTCGDATVNVAGEQCDGADLDGYSCTSLGYFSGSLTCSGTCDFDVSGCFQCAGFLYEGACWFLGGSLDTCDAVCADQGLVYNEATATVAGSGGTDAACEAVLDGVGAAGTGLDYPSSNCANGYGCSLAGGLRYRCVNVATTSTATTLGRSRVCACQ